MDRLRCIVERITYQNDQNGYSVIKCKAKGYNDLVTVVGAMPEVHVGAVLTLTGMWKIEAKYGRQFSIETFEETLCTNEYLKWLRIEMSLSLPRVRGFWQNTLLQL